ncbi:LmeA family phospholipid-binding protein [Nocardia sp. NPDC004340]|uniref:LmeA family phospholipid-binding protein n=1 Tax=Nocardia sp. CA-136227 TaxID=3239979 RepID=UPI003D960FEF
MSSEPTSDDATKRDASAAQPVDPSVRPGDSTAQPVDLGKPDGTPTEVLGARQDATTDWWNDPAHTGDPATPDPDAQPTQVLHPGEAAYAAGATGRPGPGSTPTADTAKLANGTGPTAALPGGPGYPAGPSGPITQSGGMQVPPGAPPPPAKVGGGQTGSSGPKRSRKKTLLIVALVAALLIAGGLAGGEAWARHKVEKCISSQFEAQMGSKIDVSFGWKPLLLTMIDHKVGEVTVKSDDSKFGPAQGMVVNATFHDVETKDGGKQASVGSSSADVTWSNDGITQTMAGLVSATASDPATGTLSFAVLGGLAQLQVKPKIVDGKIEVETLQASLLGFGLPTDLVSGIVKLMTESLQTYPMGLTPNKVEVTKDGLHITLQGGNTVLQADPNAQQQPILC